VIAASSDIAFDTVVDIVDTAFGAASIGYHATNVRDTTPSDVVNDQ
jgi:hypothetical protein